MAALFSGKVYASVKTTTAIVNPNIFAYVKLARMTDKKGASYDKTAIT